MLVLLYKKRKRKLEKPLKSPFHQSRAGIVSDLVGAGLWCCLKRILSSQASDAINQKNTYVHNAKTGENDKKINSHALGRKRERVVWWEAANDELVVASKAHN
uniref:Uncharacterized protein n=1 Tax=Romanomermis culicivorax TaxID=13658 RepID=A0A915IPD6_ROMCU